MSRKRFSSARGYPGSSGINIAGLIMMGIAMIFIAVGFIIYPIVMDGTDAILGYAYSGNASITDSTFTGLTSVTGVVPLITLIGFVVAGVVTGFLGYRAQRSGTGNLEPRNLMLLGVGIIFIAVGLIIYPVTLDGIAVVLHGGGTGVSSSYTGLSAVLQVTPLIVLVGFISAGIITGFFGGRGLTREH